MCLLLWSLKVRHVSTTGSTVPYWGDVACNRLHVVYMCLEWLALYTVTRVLGQDDTVSFSIPHPVLKSISVLIRVFFI